MKARYSNAFQTILQVFTRISAQYLIEVMETPTDEQAALIKITLEGRRMSYPDRYDQERLLALHQAKMLLERAFALLSQ